MMEILNNISPLPFYMDLAQQNHRKDYAFGQIYPLIIADDIILPFQFLILEGTSTIFSSDFNNDFDKNPYFDIDLAISKVLLWNFNTKLSFDITNNIIANRLELKAISPGVSLIKYPGTLPITALKQEGPYYLEIILSNGTSFYSDLFISAQDTSNCILLEYGNNYNLELPVGHIDFSDNFKFRCYLATEIGKPEYAFEEEATTRMGYTFIESQVSKKIYRFSIIAPEYLCDALRIVRLCTSKRILTKYASHKALSFSMNPSWEEQGDLAVVECSFETDTVITNIGNIL